MVGADGTIYINTKIDSSGFKLGGKEIERATKRMSESVYGIGREAEISLKKQANAFVKQNQMYAQQEQKVKDLESELSKLSGKQIETEEYAKLGKELNKLGADFDKLAEKQQIFLQGGGKENSSVYKKMEAQLDSLDAKQDQVIAKMRNLEVSGGAYKTADTGALNQKLIVEKQRLAQMNSTLGVSYESLQAKVNKYKKISDKADKSTKKLSKSTNGLGKSTKKAGFSLGKMLLTSVLFSAVFRAISAVTSGIKGGLDNLAQYSAETNQNLSALVSSLAQLKNAFATAFEPILTVVTPALTSLINALSTAITYVAQLFSALQGKSTFIKATQVQKDYAESLDETGKAAEKAKGALSAYDKLNVIQDTSGGGKEVNPEIAFEEEEVTTDLTNAIDKIKDKFAELTDLFKQGFNLGFVDTDFQSILDNMGRIKTALFNIFNSPEVKAAISRFVNNFVYSLGQITGALASIGVTIATNITGGIAKYLEENTPRIKEYIVNMFDIGSEFSLIAGQLATTLASIFTVFDSEVGQSITANLIAMVVNPFMAVTQLLASLVTDLLAGITTPIVENAEEIKTALYGLLEIFNVVTGAIAGFWTNVGDSLLATYNEHIKPAIDNVSAGLSELLAVGLKLWNEWVQPFIKDTAEKISGLMDKYINPFVSKVIKFGGQIVEIISLIWQKTIVPFISFMSQTVVPVIVKIASAIVEKFEFIGSQVGVVINTIMDILNGLAEFIAGVFSGDMERAGNGIRDIFKGIINGIIEFFENGINFIIDKINSFFSGFNGIVSDVGDVFGIDISIPKIDKVDIPRLATGAVIPPNREFLAVLGDQKHGTNIETPIDTMIDAFKQAIKEMGGVGNNGQMHVTVEIDGRVLGQTMVDLNNQSKAITGKPLLT